MTEISKDFLKLIATLIIILTIFLAVLNNGILESLFALKTYAEPLTLLDHLAAAYETAGSCPGECSLSVRTSGLPYMLNIYKENGRYYASIDASLVEEKSNVKFLPNQEKPVFIKPLISDCIISEQNLTFTEGLIQDVNIKKVIEDGICRIFIESENVSYDFNVSLGTDTLLAQNGTSSTTTVTVSLIGNLIVPAPVELSVSGLPTGVKATFDTYSGKPTFTSTLTVTVDPSAAAGTYELTITGISGGIAKTANLELEVAPTLYTFILNSKISIVNLPLVNIKVNSSNIIKYTHVYNESISNIVYSLIPGYTYSVQVENPFADLQGPRNFSHFRDLDCQGDNTGYYLDTGDNPYTFNIPSDWTLPYSRDMTAFYKAFTQIRNLEFDNVTNTIEGNLLDEDFNSISNEETTYQTCNVPTTIYPNRNVVLEYFDSCGGSWAPLSSVMSSFAQDRFYEKFDKDISNWNINSGNWNVANGELDNSGTGDESIQTGWNYWNSSDGNNNLEVSIKLLSGSNVSIRIFDSINDYFLQTNDSYGNVYLWVNGALKQKASLTGISPNQWNVWRIRQNDSYLEFYINNQKLIRYSGVPIMNFGRIMLRTLNTGAAFDNVTSYSGSWSYNFAGSCSMKKVRAIYSPTNNWFYENTSSDIDINPSTTPCKLNVTTQVDITSSPLPGIDVNVSDSILGIKYKKTTPAPNAMVQYLLTATPLKIQNITVNSTFHSRDFSHFADFDCSNPNPLYILDSSTNPYWFSICRDKNITVQYKAFTNITNASGYPNTFNYDYGKRTITGKLLDEFGNPILNSDGTKHTACTPQNVFDSIAINRNVTLEYYKSGRWYYIGANDSEADGSWYYNWGCASGATKLRANYTSSNWFYMSNSTEINIVCPHKLIVFTQADIISQPLSGVRVNVSNIINFTDTSGIAEYYLSPGNYYVDVDDPFNSRPYSHFFDSDCSMPSANQLLDTASKPYMFGMYDRDKNITVQYRTFTNITDTLGNTNKFEYNGTHIKGRLVDERNNIIIGSRNYHPAPCGSSLTSLGVNRNVTLEYFNGSWITIATIDSSKSDGSWSYAWSCGTVGASKLRATYVPVASNWFYNGTSTEITLNCNGTLDVYAFAAGKSVAANVSIGLGDTNWDGIVNVLDLSKIAFCMNAVPGDPNWDQDCDMNLDNKIDVLDLGLVSVANGKKIPINTTQFNISLVPGTYTLRAKYNNQILNQSVVVNAWQTTTANFNFLTCDGFSALNCSVPALNPGDSRSLTGSCLRSGPTFAKIDCDGNYNSHKVCNTTSLCNNMNPTVGTYSVSSTNVIFGGSFSINVNGKCPSDLLGNCLVECGVIEPNNSIIYLDTWSRNAVTTMPSVTCNQIGNYVVDYCSVGTDFVANMGWNSINNTNTIINCKGNLDVYAFANANPVAIPVAAKVAIGLGDANWDGTVDVLDLSKIGLIAGSQPRPGDLLWDQDCDMNLDNVINVLDFPYISLNLGKNTQISTTYFSMGLPPGPYQLRAKYDNQILNNMSVVVNAGQITTVNFTFPSTCDGFSALNCSVPALKPGDTRSLVGSCGRSAPTFAKIDCDGNYNSHTVCNATASPGPLCNNINPISAGYIPPPSVKLGNSFSINVLGYCPIDFPGNCLVDCLVTNPSGNKIYLDKWTKILPTTMPPITCNQVGPYTEVYCSVGTDFAANRGWNSTSAIPGMITMCTP